MAEAKAIPWLHLDKGAITEQPHVPGKTRG